MNFWMIFQVFGIVSAWAAKALEDGKITITEAAELGVQLGGLLGIPTDVSIPTPQAAEIPPAHAIGEEAPTGDAPDLTPNARLMPGQHNETGGLVL